MPLAQTSMLLNPPQAVWTIPLSSPFYRLETKNTSLFQDQDYKLSLDSSYQPLDSLSQQNGNSFFQQIKKLNLSDRFDIGSLYSKFLKSHATLISIGVEKISLEITKDDSLFFTAYKDSSMFYLENFFDDDESDDNIDQAFFSHYSNAENKYNFTGSLANTLDRLKSYASYTF